jgi:disulfide bond formation protein DsbB
MNRSSFLVVVPLFLIMVLTACGGSANAAPRQPSVTDPVAGETLFMSACAVCHGSDGQGLPGLGKNLVTSKFVAGKTDKELVEFIKVGRESDDPLNTTGVTMPPKGNNPALSDIDLANIVAYIRQLQRVQ